jgi:hypothetical protein
MCWLTSKEYVYFLEIVVQHASRQKKEKIYWPCKVCKNDVMLKDHEVICKHLVQSGFMNNYFIWAKHGRTQPRLESIVDERVEENMDVPDGVYSNHDNGCEDDIGQDDACHGDEGFDVEELMCNVAPDVLLWRRNNGFNNF